MLTKEFLTAIDNTADLSFTPDCEYHYAAPINKSPVGKSLVRLSRRLLSRVGW